MNVRCDGDAAAERVLQDLATGLERCTRVREAADCVMQACVDLGFDMPSIYLEGGERLRCVAQRGYWQVYDGLPPDAGVIGATYSQGTLHVVCDTGRHGDHIRAIPQIVAEVCVPVTVEGRTVGVLTVDSRTPLDVYDVARAQAAADAFAQRLSALGGLEPERPAEVLARLVYELACLDDRTRLIDVALAGAMSLTGMCGAGVFLGSADRLVTCTSLGELGSVLDDLPQHVVGQLADYVSLATSSYASGVAGEDFEAVQVLKDRGARSLVVLALGNLERRGGVMVLVDGEPRPEIATLVPLLEMLAATLASKLDAAGVTAALQRSRRQLAHQAQHDGLTGVATRGRLREMLCGELKIDARGSGPVLLFVDLDGFKAVNDRHGHGTGDELLVAVADRLRTAARDSDLVARIGGDEFVVLCSRVATVDDGVALARRVLTRIAAPFTLNGVRTELTACVGIAAARAGATPDELIAAADRAMYVAKRAGRGTWSIAPSV